MLPNHEHRGLWKDAKSAALSSFALQTAIYFVNEIVDHAISPLVTDTSVPRMDLSLLRIDVLFRHSIFTSLRPCQSRKRWD